MFHFRIGIQHIRVILSAAIIFAATIGSSFSVSAQSKAESLLPASGATVVVDSSLVSSDVTHPPLRLTPDKSEILELDTAVSRVIIGNEGHINLFLDTKKRAIIVPRIPGATHFTLLDDNGRIVMQRHVVVASPKQRYVRIRESCADGSCTPIRMFYCPGMCHEIGMVGEDSPVSTSSVTYVGGNGNNATETNTEEVTEE